MVEMLEKKILVTGATGFIGRNLVDSMKKSRYPHIIEVSSKDYDLSEQDQVRKMFNDIRPEVVINLAAYVGGILVNRERPGDFFYRNAMIGTMVMQEALQSGVEKFVALMGGCAYPSKAQSPIKEDDMWNGYPQEESAAYSVAKKMVIVQSKALRKQFGFNSIVLVPGNVYGPHDNYSLETSHVIPALIRKFYEAKMNGKPRVECWGTGKPTRDFIYIEDAVEGVIAGLEDYDSSEIINISSGTEVSIKELVETVARLSKFDGEILWDARKPDGQMYKGFDVSRMRRDLKYEPQHTLEQGLRKTIKWFEENYDKGIVRL